MEMVIDAASSAYDQAKNAASWALKKGAGAIPKNLDAVFEGRQGSRGSPVGFRTRSCKKEDDKTRNYQLCSRKLKLPTRF